MKLSAIQAKLVNYLLLNADCELTIAARDLHLTEKTVRYNVDFLRRSGLIAENCFFDLYRLGYTYVNLYFSLAPCSPELAQQLIATFLRHPRVSWIGELGGEYHYGVALLTRDIEDIQQELAALPTSLRPLIDRRALLVHRGLSLYPLKVLGEATTKSSEVEYGGERIHNDVDHVDRLILRALSKDPSITVRDLARLVGKAHSTVNARIANLRSSGVIRSKWYRVNFEGLSLTSYKLLVYTHGVSPDERSVFRNFCRHHRFVDHLIECVGEWEFEVGVVVTSYSQVMSTMADVSSALGPAAKSIKVLPLLSVLKLDQVPPGFVEYST